VAPGRRQGLPVRVDGITPGRGATNFAHRDQKNRAGAEVAQWPAPDGF
jgi:hypothetical protein